MWSCNQYEVGHLEPHAVNWTHSGNACSTMLAGRAFQGVGSGVILSLVEIVLADLVSLSERWAFSADRGIILTLMCLAHVEEVSKVPSAPFGL